MHMMIITAGVDDGTGQRIGRHSLVRAPRTLLALPAAIDNGMTSVTPNLRVGLEASAAARCTGPRN